MPLPPSSAAINNLEREIKLLAEKDCRANLPGDRNKDFNCNGVVSLSLLQSHIAPQYILKYKYFDEDFILKSHATKMCKVRGGIPSVKAEIETEIEQNKLVKSFNIITLCTLLFSILSSMVFPIPFKIIFGVVGVISFITSCLVRSKVSNKIYLEKKYKKKNNLIAHLNKKGIDIPKIIKEGV